MSDVKRYDCTNGHTQYCYGCYTMTPDSEGDYVTYEDYDSLKSHIAQLEAERDCMREALEMIAGKKACLDMTLSNIGIANAALYRTTRRG